MTERYDKGTASKQYEETVDPDNPPNSVLHPEVRRTALWVYVGPLVVIAVIVGIALLYWSNRGPAPNEDVTDTIGTVGDDSTPGGFDPASRPDSSRDERNFRGAEPLTSLGAMLDDRNPVIGRSVAVKDMTVVDASGSAHFSIQDGNHRIAVSAPPGSPTVRNGSRVDVSGVMESDGQGGVHIRATQIVAK
jgi:hypothetical protein